MPYTVVTPISAVLASNNVSVNASGTGSYTCQHYAPWVRVVASAPIRVHVDGWAGAAGATSLLIPPDTPTLLRHPGKGRAVSFYNEGSSAAIVNVAEIEI